MYFQSAQSPLLSTSLVHELGKENAFCLKKQRLKACPPHPRPRSGSVPRQAGPVPLNIAYRQEIEFRPIQGQWRGSCDGERDSHSWWRI